ncbi:MAG TPA: hypothetical protein VGK73_08645 [Polyangiaceae bacterium]
MSLLNRQSGRLAFPVTQGVGTFQDLDQANEILLKLFRAAIRSDLGTPFETASMGTSLMGKFAVEHYATAQPTEDYIKTSKVDFPALFVYPLDEATPRGFTVARSMTTQQWAVEFILGPLGPDEVYRLRNMFRAVLKLVTEVVRVGGHPAYAMDPANVQPQQVLYWDGDGGCGFSTVTVTGAQMGAAAFSEGGPAYHGVRVILETGEVSGVADETYGSVPHEGANFDITGDAEGDMDVGDPDDGDPDGLGDFRSDIPED